MRRLLLALVALVVISSGCSGLGGDVVATVDGADVTIDQVRQLASAIAGLDQAGADSLTTPDTLDGDAGRDALLQWVQLEAIHHEFESRGLQLESGDRESADSQVTSLEGLSKRNTARLVTLIASAIAMDRVLGAGQDAAEVPEPTAEEIAATADELIAQIPPEELVLNCADAIAGPATGADQVQALLDAGTDLDDATAFAESQYTPPSGTNPLCVSIQQLPEELQAPFRDTPVGELGRANFAAETGDQTLFFRPTGQRTLTATDPEVVDAATQQLQQEAQTAAEEQQSATQSETDAAYRKVFRRSDIEIDPRFGSFDADGGLVPPLAPLSTAPPTSAPAAAGTTP